MTTDAFGHPVTFGVRLTVGARRKDGKYPCTFVFQSTGTRINKLLTAEQVASERSKLGNP